MRDDVVLAFAEGRVVGEALACVEEHLHACADCRSVVAETAKFFQSDTSGERPAALDGPLLAPGSRVSRYVVTNVLGSGAAGVVYRAHDPQLRRKIALKLLRPEHSYRPEGATLETRLLREARAMAQLSHPNVVTVFDVGRFDGQIFLVMELVEGKTLASWLAGDHPWRERLRLFVEAARGLSAAHAVQIAHRDFKPANVLVGDDGRVRVTDFGLARPWSLDTQAGAFEQPLPAWPIPSGIHHTLFSGVTATEAGGIAGTPAFMAPEQFLRQETDARTDQFSFCVALFHALYGTAPFVGRSFDLLSDAVVNGRLEPAPASAKHVPSQVYTVLRRGLSVDPAARFPDMEALVQELLAAAQASPRSRTRVAVAALSVCSLVAAGVLVQRSMVATKVLAPAVQSSLSAHALGRPAEAPQSEHATVLPLAQSRSEPVVRRDVSRSKASERTVSERTANERTTSERTASERPSDRAKKRARRLAKKAHVPTPVSTRERYHDQLKDPF